MCKASERERARANGQFRMKQISETRRIKEWGCERPKSIPDGPHISLSPYIPSHICMYASAYTSSFYMPRILRKSDTPLRLIYLQFDEHVLLVYNRARQKVALRAVI